MAQALLVSFTVTILLLCCCRCITGIFILPIRLLAKCSLLTWLSSKHFTCIGTVSISPAHMASVCRGDQLELICTTNRIFLEWSFSLISEGETSARTYSRILNILSGPAIPGLLVNSITFSFSRVSAQDTLPLISRLLINPVSAELNGTLVNCTDIFETLETASTLVRIINEDLIYGRLWKHKVISYLKFILILSSIINMRFPSYKI